MDSRKRKAPAFGLERRVRPRAEPEPEFDGLEDDGSNAPSEEKMIDDEDDGSDPEDGSEDPKELDEVSLGEESSDDEDISVDASKVTFGAMVKAQASITKSELLKRKKKKAGFEDENLIIGENGEVRTDWKAVKKRAKEKQTARSSKHAPMEMSSKLPVSRRREIIPVKKAAYRDPRFDPLVASGATKVDDIKARKNYAFLEEYRDDELKQLKGAIRKAKTPREKEELQRAAMSMESRKKALVKRQKEEAIIEEHRQREKELVKQGKQPFYLKKSEQKKRLLLDQYASLSKRQVDKAIEKKRKKVAGKEKKELPMVRRDAEEY